MIYCPSFHHWLLPIIVLGKLFRIKTIYTVHDGILHLGEQNSLDQIWQNRCIKMADELVFLTEFVRQQAQQHVGFSGRATIIPHGINIPEWLIFKDRQAPKTPRLLFLGRILPYKGVDLLVEAVKQLPDPQYTQLMIAGELRCELNIPEGEKIILKNHYFTEREFVDLLNEHDILILPYREATQSGIISFGIATGIPMICTNVGGLHEQISPEQGAIFCEPNATAIREAILRLSTNPELYLAQHRFLKTKRKESGWAATARRIEALGSGI